MRIAFIASVIAVVALAWIAVSAPARQEAREETPARGLFAILSSAMRERLPAPLLPPPDSLAPENAWLAIDERGLDIIRESEGLRLEAYALAGQWLIGYGHAATAEPGLVISADHANTLLLADVRAAEAAVRMTVTVPLNQNEFSALTALAYNLGAGGFARTEVVRRLNAGDRAGAAAAFGYLVTAKIDDERVALDSLRRRREQERRLFLAPPLRV